MEVLPAAMPTTGLPVDHLVLPGDLTAAGCARRRARELAVDWDMEPLLDSLQLVVSELVGNAVRHGGRPVQMWLHRTGDAVRVEVQDSTPPCAMLSCLPGDDSAEAGRGLAIVAALSSGLGVHEVPGGKIVWAIVGPARSGSPA